MQDGKPWLLEYRSNTTFITGVIGIALFTDLFLYGLIVPILPFALDERLGVPQERIQSLTSILLGAYAAATVIASPLSGILADKLKTRQVPFLCGLVALSVGTALQCFGTTLSSYILARISQGVSAAVVWTVGLAMIMDTVGSANLGKTIGGIFSFISIGELAAPVTGGAVYHRFGYYGVFIIAFGLLGLDILLRLCLIEKKVARLYEDAPMPDATDFGPSEAMNEETRLLDSGDDLVPGNAISRAFPLFRVMRDPALLAAFWLPFMQALVITAFDATIPLQARHLFSFNSLEASALFAPLTVPYLIVGPLAGAWVDRSGPKRPAVIGYLFLSISLILLRIPTSGGTRQVVAYGVILFFCGGFTSLVGASSFVQASSIVEKFQKAHPKYFGEAGAYGALYGVYNIFYSLGMLVGPLLAGGLRDEIGYGNMNAVLAVMCFLTAILSYLLIGKMPRFLSKALYHEDR